MGPIQSTDAIVIGGGLTGCATAYYLAKAGVDVVLVERHDLNGEASGRNVGGLHGQILWEPFAERGEAWAREYGKSLALVHASLRLWAGLEAELGADLEVEISGGVIVAENAEQLDKLRRKAAIEREFGGVLEILGPRDLLALAPYVSPRMAGGLFCPLEGMANPLLAAPAFAAAAAARGCEVLTHTPVRGIERTGVGFRVTLADGAIACRRIVCCAGAATAEVMRLARIDVPTEAYPIQACVTEPVASLVRHHVYFAGGRMTLKQTRRGSLLLGGGWPARVDPSSGALSVDLDGLGANLRHAVTVVPEVAGVALQRAWTGLSPGTSDRRPVIGEVAPGLFVALFPGVGFTCGPLTGQLTAAIVLGDKPAFDLAPFAPSRFAAAAS